MKIISKILKFILALVLVIILSVGGISLYVVKSVDSRVVAEALHSRLNYSESLSAVKAKRPEYIIVLGAGIKADKTPGPMLKDRLDLAIALYKDGVAPKLFLTGDNSHQEYNEVKSMQRYVMGHGVPEHAIVLDPSGFSTYESMYRAAFVFNIKTAVVATQEYHLYRALYIAKSMGIDVYGASANQAKYQGQFRRDMREILARDKDFIKCIYKPKPPVAGNPIPPAQ